MENGKVLKADPNMLRVVMLLLEKFTNLFNLNWYNLFNLVN